MHSFLLYLQYAFHRILHHVHIIFQRMKHLASSISWIACGISTRKFPDSLSRLNSSAPRIYHLWLSSRFLRTYTGWQWRRSRTSYHPCFLPCNCGIHRMPQTYEYPWHSPSPHRPPSDVRGCLFFIRVSCCKSARRSSYPLWSALPSASPFHQCLRLSESWPATRYINRSRLLDQDVHGWRCGQHEFPILIIGSGLKEQEHLIFIGGRSASLSESPYSLHNMLPEYFKITGRHYWIFSPSCTSSLARSLA